MEVCSSATIQCSWRTLNNPLGYPQARVNDYTGRSRNVSFSAQPSSENGGGVLQDPLFAESHAGGWYAASPKADAQTQPWPAPLPLGLGWWATQRVLPDPENRITDRNKRIAFQYLAKQISKAQTRLGFYRWLRHLAGRWKAGTPRPRWSRQALDPSPLGEQPLRQMCMGYACGKPGGCGRRYPPSPWWASTAVVTKWAT